MDRWGITEEIPIENRIITGFIEKAQKKVEEYYFSIRKSVLEFDDVMNKQRDTIYRLRRRILERAELKEKVFEMLDAVVERQVTTFTPEKTDPSEWDWEGLQKSLKDINPLVAFTGLEQYKNREGLTEEISKHFKESYDQKEANISSEHMRNLERVVMLRVLDQKWIEQLDNMDNLRDGINLRAYGQRDPLIEYKIEGYGMFQEMMEAAQDEIIGMLYKVALVREGEEIAAPIARNITLGAPAEGSSRVTVRKTSEVGRNDPCPCGSGKKYKKCCLLKEGKA
jgi:preprotein translocase subunit SecA